MRQYLVTKESNCKNCYKCIRHCPVKSIRFSDNQAYILEEDCIQCGHCYVICPQNAKKIRDDTALAKQLLSENEKVVVSMAPSFVARYPGVNKNELERAIKALGFYEMEETALGATLVKWEYEKMIRSNEMDIIISSCCHSVNLLIQKYFPEVLPYLANIVSPAQAHCKDIKRRHENAKTVFIGPCISKKAEADSCSDRVDCVLTFTELDQWLQEAGITLETENKLYHPSNETLANKTKEDQCLKNEKWNANEENFYSKARLFPVSGGILKTMNLESDNYAHFIVDGPENCLNALRDISEGRLDKCFIEMSACSGSCIGGPAMEENWSSIVRNNMAVYQIAGKEDFIIEPLPQREMEKEFQCIGAAKTQITEETMRDILLQMGKHSESDELNCGTCGYNTCREKAEAVYLGKADLSMCLPYLKERAESFSNNIIKHTPNGVLVLNESLEVQEINEAARKILNIRMAPDVLGQPVFHLLNPKIFFDAMLQGKPRYEQRVYLPMYDKYIEQTVIYDKSYHRILCIMSDRTEEEQEKEQKKSIIENTIKTTDQVIEKQMRIVQEIASLLGETTAETKIALTELKESLNP